MLVARSDFQADYLFFKVLNLEFKAEMAFKCHICKELFMNNVQFMKHLSLHVDTGRTTAIGESILYLSRSCRRDSLIDGAPKFILDYNTTFLDYLIFTESLFTLKYRAIALYRAKIENRKGQNTLIQS